MLLEKNTLEQFPAWLDAAGTSGAVALIDKARGWTSFDVVAKMRGISRIRKVGHAGTLDPLATGLLILCFGKATKTIESYQAAEKYYNARIRLGATTKTDDAEGEEENQRDYSSVQREHLEQALPRLCGEIEQIPPMYSAVKKNGVRLYKLARKGTSVEREARRVSVHSMEVTEFAPPFIGLNVHCSKGTYIRSLARDLGVLLGCGAYLADLRRTGIGAYSVERALHIEDILRQNRPPRETGAKGVEL